jgi:apolipoprotein D and lipocalin family protein
MKIPLIAAALVAATTVAQQTPLAVVPTLDAEKYAGRWYEIARFPNQFQDHCAGDVTAEYTPRPDGRITVVNRCRKANGEWDEAEGVARRLEGAPPSALEVRFAPAILSFIPAVWGDYQVMALDESYTYSLVGTPDRKYLWILSRTPSLDEGTYKKLTDVAAGQGFDVSKLVKTTHVKETTR